MTDTGTTISETATAEVCSESDEWDLITPQPGNPELSVESALLWCLSPAIHGIKSIGVLPADDRARKLLSECGGDTNAAVVQAAGGESGGVKRSKIIIEFLLRQVPFVGCPAFILTSTWTHLRAVATIAAIYGHDLEQPRTQHEILWCLLPAQPEGGPLPSPPMGDTGPITATAKTVSTILISTALKRVAGISMVTELFQLGTDLWTISSQEEDGFEHLALGPASTARSYFCPESQFSKQLFFITLLGVVIPFLFRLPGILSALLVLVACIGYVNRLRIMKSSTVWLPSAASYSIFGAHAALPVVSISSGLSLFLQAAVPVIGISVAERLSLLVLSTMSLSGGLKNASIQSDLMETINTQTRTIAIVIGVVFHVLPFFDRTNVYSTRLAWLLSDTELCTMSRSLHFISVIISSTFQFLLVSQLKRRDIILKLLGAERVMVLSLTLFFRGVTAAVSTESLLPFFRRISPHPFFCCLIMTLRSRPLEAAALLSIVPMIPVWLPFPALSLLTGITVGTGLVVAVWRDWKFNENAYMSNMRLLYILPGVVTGKTREVVDSMLKAGGRTAFKSILTGFAKRLSTKIFTSKIV
jgi:hypothetical protein